MVGKDTQEPKETSFDVVSQPKEKRMNWRHSSLDMFFDDTPQCIAVQKLDLSPAKKLQIVNST